MEEKNQLTPIRQLKEKMAILNKFWIGFKQDGS